MVIKLLRCIAFCWCAVVLSQAPVYGSNALDLTHVMYKDGHEVPWNEVENFLLRMACKDGIDENITKVLAYQKIGYESGNKFIIALTPCGPFAIWGIAFFYVWDDIIIVEQPSMLDQKYYSVLNNLLYELYSHVNKIILVINKKCPVINVLNGLPGVEEVPLVDRFYLEDGGPEKYISYSIPKQHMEINVDIPSCLLI